MPLPGPAPAPLYDDVTCESPGYDEAAWRRGMWSVTRAQLERLAAVDNSFLGLSPEEPIPMVARLFVAYSEIVKRLDWVWGMTYQYQKSQAMRRFVDAATTRLEELKNALTELHISEYHYVDNELIELKLIPRDLEIIPLSAYPIEQAAQLQELAERLFKGERIYIPPVPFDEDEEEDDEDKKEVKFVMKRPVIEVKIDPVWEAQKAIIILVQIHERARTARLEFLDEKVVWLLRHTIPTSKPKKIPLEEKNAAATNIQRLWRGHCIRRDMKKRYYRSRILVNMDVPSWRSTELQDKLKGFEDIKKKRRKEKVQEYIDACLKEKERVLRVVGPGLMEDIGDEIRCWFRNWYDVALAFDKYPEEEDGGTIIVIRGETLTPEQFREEQEKKRREKEKMKNNPALAKKAQEEKEKKKKEAQKAAKAEKLRLKKERQEAKKRAKLGIVEPFQFKEGPAFEQMKDANERFEADWTLLDEEIATDEDLIVMDRITEDKCYEVQLEMRKIVDEMMRLELEQLEDAHFRDKTAGKKGKKPPKPKKKKKKKGKKGKKDPTGDRQIEDLFQELYDNKVIRPYPQVDINTFIGDYGYNTAELREVDLDPLPCVGEAKLSAVNNCIIPLGGQNIPKPKSVLIYGPRQSGKKLLVNAICTSSQAVMFDLSPKVTAGIYPGKAGMNMFMHLVNKMSRILQPSVIFIDGAEKVFYKKVPKPEKALDPKKLKSKLMKEIVKKILPEDRVMLIGTSNQPWAAGGQLSKTYEKYIMIPRTDYGTCYQLWMDLLMNYHGVQRDMDVSAIAKLSIGYPIPYIRQVAAEVLCPKRLIRLQFEPLRQHEILEGLMLNGQPEPITPQEQDKFTTWQNKKTKMGKLRSKIVGEKREERLAQEALLARQKEKKKK